MDTPDITKKGIPVVDNNGEQQAEIERNEIIFRLELTQRLEQLYKDGSDKAAIIAGKLLTKEILHNTEDRTGLLEQFKQGGEIQIAEEGIKIEIKPQQEIESHKQGGSFNIIPEGALHARKNNMEGAGEDFTHKGIPVIDNDGNQQAEIELNEIIFRLEVTKQLESMKKDYEDSNKDEIAIEAGKLLVKEILNNTIDRTGLIEIIDGNN